MRALRSCCLFTSVLCSFAVAQERVILEIRPRPVQGTFNGRAAGQILGPNYITPKPRAKAAKPKALPATHRFRTWRSRSGKHSVRARAVGLAEKPLRVQLERQDGKRVLVDVRKLSKADRDFVTKFKASGRYKVIKTTVTKTDASRS